MKFDTQRHTADVCNLGRKIKLDELEERMNNRFDIQFCESSMNGYYTTLRFHQQWKVFLLKGMAIGFKELNCTRHRNFPNYKKYEHYTLLICELRTRHLININKRIICLKHSTPPPTQVPAKWKDILSQIGLHKYLQFFMNNILITTAPIFLISSWKPCKWENLINRYVYVLYTPLT